MHVNMLLSIFNQSNQRLFCIYVRLNRCDLTFRNPDKMQSEDRHDGSCSDATLSFPNLNPLIFWWIGGQFQLLQSTQSKYRDGGALFHVGVVGNARKHGSPRHF